MESRAIIALISRGFELAGATALVIGAVAAVVVYVRMLRQHLDRQRSYLALREGLGRAILIGIEFLVAADILRTVAIAPTLDSVITLGLIVLIRTFLSWALEVEIEGEWPWQRVKKPPSPHGNSSLDNVTFGVSHSADEMRTGDPTGQRAGQRRPVGSPVERRPRKAKQQDLKPRSSAPNIEPGAGSRTECDIARVGTLGSSFYAVCNTQ